MPLQISCIACQWEIQDQRAIVDGNDKVVGKLVVIQDAQSGTIITIPLDEVVARQWAARLDGRPAVDIATSMPPEIAGQNGHGSVQQMRPRH